MDAFLNDAVVLHMFQDFEYLDMSNEAPERVAALWADAISELPTDNVASAQVADVAVPPRGSAGPVGLPHADVIVTLAQWAGAGVVAVALQQLWENVRQRRPARSSDVARRELAIGEAEALARWIIVADYLEPIADAAAGDAMDTLELREHDQSAGGFQFVFDHAASGWRYDITLVHPDGVPFAVASHIRCTQISYDDGIEVRAPLDHTFIRAWRFLRGQRDSAR
ncbi:MAG: hypothetical protein M3083_00645 [Actinomycetota bacterium]|nr:hypothetical protein [Actinomycetota bacterium]MDQ6945088.1 hypothetical protein [Actinomycetota bacterium]